MNNIINITMDNGNKIKIYKNPNLCISPYELKENLEGLFELKTSYESKERINLSKICDTVYDLIFYGKHKETKEIVFKLC